MVQILYFLQSLLLEEEKVLALMHKVDSAVQVAAVEVQTIL
jgi:hypothetical protein